MENFYLFRWKNFSTQLENRCASARDPLPSMTRSVPACAPERVNEFARDGVRRGQQGDPAVMMPRGCTM